ncbi:MAG: septum formation initiator family protein [Candidatus Omnitrophica bacterium]|nr:septum formation initiator family protein [Candidatus Omnitrophota bacterium]
MKHLFKRFFWPVVLLAAVAVMFLPGFAKIHELKGKNTDLQRKNKRLQTENELLRSELSRVEKDGVYQEKILREKMGVVRKDEVPVKVISDVNN